MIKIMIVFVIMLHSFWFKSSSQHDSSARDVYDLSVLVNLDLADLAQIFNFLFFHCVNVSKLCIMDDDHSVSQFFPEFDQLVRVVN